MLALQPFFAMQYRYGLQGPSFTHLIATRQVAKDVYDYFKSTE